jgi:hypothetical protein
MTFLTLNTAAKFLPIENTIGRDKLHIQKQKDINSLLVSE